VFGVKLPYPKQVQIDENYFDSNHFLKYNDIDQPKKKARGTPKAKIGSIMNPIPMGYDSTNNFNDSSVPEKYRDDPELYYALQASMGLDVPGSSMYDQTNYDADWDNNVGYSRNN
jgi:hypothetical protein